jgi:hypothetical protein
MVWSLSSKKDQENAYLVDRVKIICSQTVGRAGILRATLIKSTFVNCKTTK